MSNRISRPAKYLKAFLDPVMGIHFSLPDARKQSSQGVAFRPL